jgi:hypothetical protein
MCAKVKTEALEEGCRLAKTSEGDSAKRQRRFGKPEMKNRVGDNYLSATKIPSRILREFCMWVLYRPFLIAWHAIKKGWEI